MEEEPMKQQRPTEVPVIETTLTENGITETKKNEIESKKEVNEKMKQRSSVVELQPKKLNYSNTTSQLTNEARKAKINGWTRGETDSESTHRSQRTIEPESAKRKSRPQTGNARGKEQSSPVKQRKDEPNKVTYGST